MNTRSALNALLLCVEGMDQDTLDSDFEKARDDARAALKSPDLLLEAAKYYLTSESTTDQCDKLFKKAIAEAEEKP